MFKDKKYEEWQVDPVYDESGKKVVEFREVRKLRTVSITDSQAADMNNDSWCTKLMYKKVGGDEKKEPSEKEIKAVLREKIRAAGVSVSNNTSLEDLQKKAIELNIEI